MNEDLPQATDLGCHVDHKGGVSFSLLGRRRRAADPVSDPSPDSSSPLKDQRRASYRECSPSPGDAHCGAVIGTGFRGTVSQRAASRKGWHVLGGFHAAVLCCWTLVSYRLATVFPCGGVEPREAEVYAWWRDRLPLLRVTGDVLGGSGGAAATGTPVAWSLVTCVFVSWMPFLLLTVSFLMALAWCQRHRASIDEACVAIVKRWSIVCVLVALPASPVFVQDFWLSLAWGRLAVAGLDPYTTALQPAMLPPHLLDGIAVDHNDPGMTYGPAWALLSAAVMGVADGLARLIQGVFPGFVSGGIEVVGSPSSAVSSGVAAGAESVSSAVVSESRVLGALIGAALFKSILAGAWIGCILLVDRISWTRFGSFGSQHRLRSLLLIGWMPIAPLLAVAEGHNESVLVFLLVLGLVWISQHRLLGTVTLVLSVLVKYVTLPVLLLHLMDGRARRGHSTRSSLKNNGLLADTEGNPSPGHSDRGVTNRARKREIVFQRDARIVVAVLLLSIGLVPLLIGRERLGPAVRMIDWQFLTPREAARMCERVLEYAYGWETMLFSSLVWLLPWGIALAAVWRWWRTSSVDASPDRADEATRFRSFHVAAFLLLLSTALSLGHTWPWFLLWPLPLAAVVPNAPLSRVFVSLALTAPLAFQLVVNTIGLSHFVRFQMLSGLWILLAIATWVALPREWLGGRPTR